MADINGFKISTLGAPTTIVDNDTFLPVVGRNTLSQYQNYKLSLSDIRDALGTIGGVGSSLTMRGVISSQTNLLANSIYLLNSNSASFNVYLPVGADGDVIKFADYAGTIYSNSPAGLGKNPVNIFAGIGNNIHQENFITLNEDNQNLELTFHSSRWVITGT